MQGNHGDAVDALDQARKIAEKERFSNELRVILSLTGISIGKLRVSDHLDALRSVFDE
jgi:hypothetical protein